MADLNLFEAAQSVKGKCKGRSIASNGYVLIRVGTKHHLADVRGYAYEHRLVAEKKIGRRLREGEIVHHINENKQDNRPENIVVVNGNAEHYVHHRKRHDLKLPGEENPTIACACGCGTLIAKFDASGRPRRYVSGHNPPEVTPTITAILNALGSEALHRSEVAKRTGLTKQAVMVCLSKLKRQGRVRIVSRGIWETSKQNLTKD